MREEQSGNQTATKIDDNTIIHTEPNETARNVEKKTRRWEDRH